METSENNIIELRREIDELETRVTKLNYDVEKASNKLDNNLLKQIEILAVFLVLASLALTNIIGIGILGSLGIRGLAVINAFYLITAFILLLGIRFIVIGYRKK